MPLMCIFNQNNEQEQSKHIDEANDTTLAPRKPDTFG